MNLMTCRNVSFSYDGNIAVKDVNFHIDEGDYICVVGENGSGKSTLIKGILNLIKPNSGEIIMSDILAISEIGYLPQQSIVQRDFPASVQEIVISGRLSQRGLSPFYSKRDKEIAKINMEKLKISNLKNRCYRELSGGQQQRVLLARALCSTGKLLLLDEPVSGLDPLATQELYELVSEINKNFGVSILMISHDIDSAVRHSDKILHLHKNQLFFGSTAAYLESDISKRFFNDRQGERDEYNN